MLPHSLHLLILNLVLCGTLFHSSILNTLPTSLLPHGDHKNTKVWLTAEKTVHTIGCSWFKLILFYLHLFLASRYVTSVEGTERQGKYLSEDNVNAIKAVYPPWSVNQLIKFHVKQGALNICCSMFCFIFRFYQNLQSSLTTENFQKLQISDLPKSQEKQCEPNIPETGTKPNTANLYKRRRKRDQHQTDCCHNDRTSIVCDLDDCVDLFTWSGDSVHVLTNCLSCQL